MWISNATKHYGRSKALDDVSPDIHRDEVVAVIGVSGSGKSTLCCIVNRLEPIQGGQIEIDGILPPQKGRALAQLYAEVGMAFQPFNLLPHRVALDNIILAPIKARGIPRGRVEEQARKLPTRVGLEDQVNKCPSQLFGDQQQRVATTRALVMNPKLILFDEPTSVPDPEMTNEVLDVIKDLTASGMTVPVVTHEMDFACPVADRIVFMGGGQIVESGRPAEFSSSPRMERARGLLSKVLSHRAPNRILSRVRRPSQAQRLGRPLPVRTKGTP